VATRTHDSLDQMRNDWQKVDLKGVLCQTLWVMDGLQFADEMKDIIIQCMCACVRGCVMSSCTMHPAT